MTVEQWYEDRANAGSEVDFDPELCECESDSDGIVAELCAYCKRFEEREGQIA